IRASSAAQSKARTLPLEPSYPASTPATACSLTCARPRARARARAWPRRSSFQPHLPRGVGLRVASFPKRGHQSRNTDSWEALMSVQRATVLVGIDGSPDSDRALGWAADEAARFGMSLRIVHVAETATLDVAGRGAGEVSEALAEAGDRILQDGRGLALHPRPGLAVETTLVHDRNVPAGLRRYAGEAAEVVIGHRGRGGFTGLLLGSTALRVAGRFPGPVVVVRGPVDGTADEVVVGLDLVEDPAPALDHAFAAAAAREARLRALHAWRPAPLAAEAGVDV